MKQKWYAYPLTLQRQCPSERVYVAQKHHVDNTNYSGWPESVWCFGPDTVNRWPQGDYLQRGEYYERALNISDLTDAQHISARAEHYCFIKRMDPQLYIDEGL